MRYKIVIYQFLLIFTLALISNGCSSLSGSLFKVVSEVPEDHSVVYLYRLNDKINTEFMIKYNNVEICILENNGYFPLFVKEGKVEISSLVQFKMFATGILDAAMAGSSEFVFEAVSGKSYYLKCSAEEFSGQRLTIDLVPENFGVNNIRECRLLQPDI